ncbi:MAG: hypothetical protein NTZ34_06035 [Chloroflexi bacterium]|nr:hypothetical protein [Chloroflexota bacterium]
MRYVFLSVHSLVGVQYPKNQDDDIKIADYPYLKAEVILTQNANKHLYELDQAHAIAIMALKGLTGEKDAHIFNERVEHQIEELREIRKKEIKGNVFMAFKAEGDTDLWDPKSQLEMGDVVVAIDAIPEGVIRSQYEKTINAILASFFVGCEDICGTDTVGEGTFYIDEKNRLVFTHYWKILPGKIVVSRYLGNETLLKIGGLALEQKVHIEINEAERLLNRSYKKEDEPLFSFLAAWTGLETLTERIFKHYENNIYYPETENNGGNGFAKVVERVRTVMQDKWNIRDKFMTIAASLSPDNCLSDASKFKEIKDIRDKFFHTQSVEINELPIEDTQKLLRKYIRLHIEHSMK